MNGNVDINNIIFAVLAVFIILRLRSVLGQRTGSRAAKSRNQCTNQFRRRLRSVCVVVLDRKPVLGS
jgi:hypothetical protein